LHFGVLSTSYPCYPGDPSGHFVHSEVAELLRTGHQVTLFIPQVSVQHASTSHDTGSLKVVGLGGGSAFGWPGVATRVGSAPWRVVSVAAFLLRATTALRSAECERLIAHWLLPCAWPLGLAYSGPIEAVVHGGDTRLFLRLPQTLRRRVFADLARRDVHLRFVAEALRRDIGISCGHPLYPRSRVAPCVLDIPVVVTRAAAREELGIPESQFIALVVGRLVSSKRIDVALRARIAPPHCRWVVLGDGPLRGPLQRSFPEVTFHGLVPRAQALLWMRAADVLVSASNEEGAPTAIREARALGLRVWACAAGDVATWAAEDPGIQLFEPV
jgi:teichuronic acid biosynthesis glycosyltransferase TuaC